MTNFFTPDIPRYYTALAEWAAAFVYILALKPRYSWKTIALISAGAYFLQSFFLVFTANLPIGFWLPCMVLAVAFMVFYIHGCGNVGWCNAIYFGMQAFVTAEFIASLQWQLEWFFRNMGMPMSKVGEVISVLLTYGSLLLFCWWMVSRHLPKDSCLVISSQECISSVVIGIVIFVISNLSFLGIVTPFSARSSPEISIIRTLVDWGGCTLLYSHLVQCCELRAKLELEALENVFRNQYLQYRQSKDNIDMINYKYHDLKHQIAVLRSEENPEKRKAYLDQMEEEIRRYEVENKTGNKVLDTVLTGKGITCAKNKITFTCVADGTLLDFMETADICSIFGNALDNAIEYESTIAEQEKRLIHVTVSRQKDFLMIRVENYFEGELQMEQGNLLTTKGNKESHGYGIKSIRYTAGKYDGVVEISTGDQWFTLQVMIPIPSTNSKENF